MDLYNKILDISKEIAIKDGLNNINMRLIAKNCNIAVGSIYNYFPSKSDLVIATIEAIWKDIFNTNTQSFNFDNFIDCLNWLFNTVSENILKYPDFFTLHSLSLNNDQKIKGSKAMECFFKSIKYKLLKILEKDKNVKSNVFNDFLTPTIFIDYVFTLLISILIQKQNNCKPLLKFIENSIY